jgi:hypothetical protein
MILVASEFYGTAFRYTRKRFRIGKTRRKDGLGWGCVVNEFRRYVQCKMAVVPSYIMLILPNSVTEFENYASL